MLNSLCKRSLDIIGALLGLFIGAPVFLLISILLWLESPGNIFFVQTRLGRGGQPFKLYKFRKFPVNMGQSGTGVTVAGDARMTTIGRLLERTKLDELPQLWNILKGEMSFVGPRPETPRFADLFQGRFSQIFNYTPGIFGPNQIAYRNESKMYPPDEPPEQFYRRVLFPAKANNDLNYFSQANCWKDIVWIIKGIGISLIGTFDWQRLAALHLKIILIDLILIIFAWGLAWLIRYEAKDLALFYRGLWIPPALLFGLILGGVYSHPIRYFSFNDAIRLFAVASISWLILFIILIGLFERGISILILPLVWSFLIPLLMMPRVGHRFFDEKKAEKHTGQKKSVLIYGAGRLGLLFANWVKTQPHIHLIGFIDDDQNKIGRKIAGFNVLGRLVDLATIKERYPEIEEAWISFPITPTEPILNQFESQHIRPIFIYQYPPFCTATTE